MTNHDKKTNFLTGITLEGFQVFDKPTYIPLESLTLLFGPNSAGKSAVQDAIELYKALLFDDDAIYNWKSENDFVYRMLKRHWRRAGVNNEWVNHLSLSVNHTTQCNLYETLSYDLGREIWGDLKRTGDAWQIESRWNFQRNEKNKDLTFSICFELLIENIMLAKHKKDQLIINIAHPLISKINFTVDFSEIAKIYPDYITIKNNILNISANLDGFHPRGVNSIEIFSMYKNHDGYFIGSDIDENLSLLFSAIEELNIILRSILRTSSSNSRFKPILVGASRKTPNRRDLVVQLGYLDDQIEPPLPKIERCYQRLAASIANIPSDDWRGGGYIGNSSSIINPWMSDDLSSYGKRINKALSDHLFIEQGYRIDHDIRVLMSKENSQAAIIGDELNQNQFGYVIELFLRDSHNCKHLFEDVGSGIGYVLPVLCAIFESNEFSSTSFIQQPELHIHPALQAAMGDVFIEARNGGNKQILIETHSEHLLLRILKRIRQTHLQAHVAPELKINADDVCVLYFDPLPDGTTIVKRLRITEDGEFMDRWPRGFFGERDQELLDE